MGSTSDGEDPAEEAMKEEQKRKADQLKQERIQLLKRAQGGSLPTGDNSGQTLG